MFILTQDDKIINTDYLSVIYKSALFAPTAGGSICARSPKSKNEIFIASFDTKEAREKAFDDLVLTLTVRKAIYTFK